MNDFYDYDPTNFIMGLKQGKACKIGHFNIIGKNVVFGNNVRIDNSVIIDEDVQIADNSYIGSWVHLRPGVRIGHDSEIRDLSFVGPGAQVGNHTRFCHQCFICKHSIVGDWCYVAPGLQMANTKVMTYGREFTNESTIQERFSGTPIIEDGVRIGAAVTILPGVTLAKDCYIGGGAVVLKSTKSFGVYVGNPARWIKDVPENERITRC